MVKKFKKGDIVSFTYWKLDKNYDPKIWNCGGESEEIIGVILFTFPSASIEHYTVYTLQGCEKMFPENTKLIPVDVLEHRELLEGYYKLLKEPGMLVD